MGGERLGVQGLGARVKGGDQPRAAPVVQQSLPCQEVEQGWYLKALEIPNPNF